MHASTHKTSVQTLLAGLLVVAGCTSSTLAAANDSLPPELANSMIQMSANLNHVAVACGDLSAKDMEAKRELQRTELLKTTKLSATEYERLYAQASKAFQAKWTPLSAAQKQQTCTAMKQQSGQTK